MPSKSKTKGKAWEREAAHLLTEAFDAPFQRVPSSGAFTGGANRHRMESMDENQINASRGDLMNPDGWNAVWECKHVKKGTVSDILEGPSAAIDKWWTQACSDARRGELVILLVKEDRKSPRAFFAEHRDFQWVLEGPWAVCITKSKKRLISCLMADLIVNAASQVEEAANCPIQEDLL